jgi:hypothetical protein
MVIILTCSCGKHLQVADDHAGQRGLCPACASNLSIPAAAAPAAPLEPGERALPLLLAAPETEPSPTEAAVSPATEAAVEPPQPREPELAPAPTAAAVISLELPAEQLLPPTGSPPPQTAAVSRDAPAETVVVAPMPLSALLADEPEPLDFIDRQLRPRPRYGVFPPYAVCLATLLGGCVAGSIVLAYNYQTVRRRWAMRLSGAAGIVSFLVFLVLISVWPQIHDVAWLRLALFALMAPLWIVFSPAFPLVEKSASLVPAVLALGVAWLLQRDLYYGFLRQGGRPASVLNAIGMSLFCAVFTFTGVGLHFALFPESKKTQARVLVLNPGGFRQVNVYYHPGVDQEDARRVGKFLTSHGPIGVTTFHLTPWRHGLVVSFVVGELHWEDPILSQMIVELVQPLSETLDGRPIRVEFCNEELTRRRPIR